MARSVDAQAVDPDELARALVATTPGGIVRVLPDGRIVDANAQACQLLGLRLDDLTRTYIADFETRVVDEQGRTVPVEAYPVSITLGTGEPAGPMTLGVERPDGETSWAVYHSVPLAEAGGGLAGALVTLLDIGDRIRVEGELRRSEERWRSLVANLPDFVITYDARGYLRTINRTVEGMTTQDAEGRHFGEFMPADATAHFAEMFERVIETGETITFETQGNAASGSVAWYESVLCPSRREGTVDGVIVIARNIDARKRLEEELARSQRLAAIGMLAAGIAHEINNPLTYILGSLDFALARPHDDEAGAALAEARAGAERVRAIVRDLKLLAREQDATEGPADLRKVVDAALGIVDSELRHRARVVRTDADLPKVRGNEGRLVQVVINLLVNAMQAIADSDPARHVVRVTTRAAADGRSAELVIEDDGEGIAAEHLPRIFDPFFTTKPAGTGTGLGLPICHSIVTASGGVIEIDSEPQRGTRAFVRLPFARGPARSPTRNDEPNLPPRRRVLVVDDEAAVARALGRMIGDVHDVRIANDGDQALELIEREPFDIVLCDVMMPRVSGIDVYERVRAGHPELAGRFVLVTGGVFAPEIRARLEGHGVPCLFKPFDRAILLEVVERVTASSLPA
jgi:PAS domain S-box-containing protein